MLNAVRTFDEHVVLRRNCYISTETLRRRNWDKTNWDNHSGHSLRKSYAQPLPRIYRSSRGKPQSTEASRSFHDQGLQESEHRVAPHAASRLISRWLTVCTNHRSGSTSFYFQVAQAVAAEHISALIRGSWLALPPCGSRRRIKAGRAARFPPRSSTRLDHGALAISRDITPDIHSKA